MTSKLIQSENENDDKDLSFYLQMLERLREEDLNKKTNTKLLSHPYLMAAKNGTLTLIQRQAFVSEQYAIQYSDACSFATLAGHNNFKPTSLVEASIPGKLDTSRNNKGTNDDQIPNLFQFLLEGEIYASQLLLDHAKSVGIKNEEELKSYPISALAQAYPSYWSRLALSQKRGSGAAACAVNFPAWGKMCGELFVALKSHDIYGYTTEKNKDNALEFIKFFATPIKNLDEMAAKIMMEERITYDEVVTVVRLLQEYEVLFWDAIYERK